MFPFNFQLSGNNSVFFFSPKRRFVLRSCFSVAMGDRRPFMNQAMKRCDKKCVELCNFYFCCAFTFCQAMKFKKFDFLVGPELLVNDILGRVALGMRMRWRVEVLSRLLQSRREVIESAFHNRIKFSLIAVYTRSHYSIHLHNLIYYWFIIHLIHCTSLSISNVSFLGVQLNFVVIPQSVQCLKTSSISWLARKTVCNYNHKCLSTQAPCVVQSIVIQARKW